jgi:hypothetical protein
METVSGLTGLISLAIQAGQVSYTYAEKIRVYKSEYAQARYPTIWGRWLSKFGDVDSAQSLYWNINCWKDEEVKA